MYVEIDNYIPEIATVRSDKVSDFFDKRIVTPYTFSRFLIVAPSFPITDPATSFGINSLTST